MTPTLVSLILLLPSRPPLTAHSLAYLVPIPIEHASMKDIVIDIMADKGTILLAPDGKTTHTSIATFNTPMTKHSLNPSSGQ